MSRVDAASEPLTALNAPEARVAVLEARLKEAVAEISDLRARDALKTQFLANISHDLRTPLTAVITHAEILRDGILGDLTPRQLESVRGIISGGRQLLNQVGEILTYAAERPTSSHSSRRDSRSRKCSSRSASSMNRCSRRSD